MNMRRVFGRLLWVLCLAMAFPMQGYGAEKITTVKVKFEVGEPDENGIPVMEAETDSEKYTVNDVMTLEEYAMQWSDWEYTTQEDVYDAEYEALFGEEDDDEDDEEDEDDERKIDTDLLAWNKTYRAVKNLSEIAYVVELEASDGYKFTSNKDKIKLSGAGASCIKLERYDSRTIMVLYVRFSGLDDYVNEEISFASWEEGGIGTWEELSGADRYELRLYDGASLQSSGKTTGASAYDFRPLMQKSGSYHYEIRPVSSQGEKGPWTQSTQLTVTEEMAAANQSRFGIEKIPEGDGSGPPLSYTYPNIGWKQESDGRWWYQEQDGSYPQQNWLWYQDRWYFFDACGFMEQNAYVKWGGETYYLDGEGHMITEGKAPDGRLAAADGKLSWPER